MSHKKTEEKRIKFMLRMPPALRTRLNEQASARNVSVSDLILEFLEKTYASEIIKNSGANI